MIKSQVASKSPSSQRLFLINQSLSSYPILGDAIREAMRAEMFSRSIMQAEAFEDEVQRLAIESQRAEGINVPSEQEDSGTWELRKRRIREYLTILRFSQNLSFQIFERLLKETLGKRGLSTSSLMQTMNIEMVPMEMVFAHAKQIESLPIDDRAPMEHRLQEARVVLIRTLISDQLRYVNIAKQWFNIDDLEQIRSHKIGAGRIGGKAAGLLLANRILADRGSKELKDCLMIPKSYYIGSGELYTFMAVNELGHWNNQKYKTEEQMRSQYAQIVAEFEQGGFPPDIMEKLKAMMADFGKKPLIVRSSSLLEDNFGTSFAGKYESVFLPNQSTPQKNLKALLKAMGQIYASTLNPGALLYRRNKGLQDYDERMGLLIQEVQGEAFENYYMPHAAGVAFSRNLYRWSPQIRREDGFVRLVWGLGTRAVDRVGNDYPRLIALSHPLLRPSTDARAIRRYSQQYVDLLDLKQNEFKTLPVHDVITGRYPSLRYLAQIDEGGYFTSLRTSILDGDTHNLVFTFDELLRRTPFAERMREILDILEDVYKFPVDTEFTLRIKRTETGEPQIKITVLQCRPQSFMVASEAVQMPSHLDPEDLAFSTNFMVPEGHIKSIKYVVFVPAEGYFALPNNSDRHELARIISQLNTVLKHEPFILVGPGRWGSSNTDLGVPVDYGGIYNSKALIELTGRGIGPAPEPSLGTHFFQDLMEAHIYPLAIYLDDPLSIFKQEFFYDTPNRISELLPNEEGFHNVLRVIRVSDYRPNHSLEIVMSDEKSQAVAYFKPD